MSHTKDFIVCVHLSEMLFICACVCVLCISVSQCTLKPCTCVFAQDREDQWMTKLVPGVNDFVLLQPLQWNTQYEVEITARNIKGLSEPTTIHFSMPQKPDITGTRTSVTHTHTIANTHSHIYNLLSIIFLCNVHVMHIWTLNMHLVL